MDFSRRCFCLSRMRKVATPRPLLLSSSTHFCAVAVSFTTMKSRAPAAVETATSYLASIAPRSPAIKRWDHRCRQIGVMCSVEE